MKTINKYIIAFFVAVVAMMLPAIVNAQVLPPGLGGDNPDVPIDGGLSALLAAGAGYVIKKGYHKRKKQNKTDK